MQSVSQPSVADHELNQTPVAFDAAVSEACSRLSARSVFDGAPSLGISMVRNEQDVIERFVRHALKSLDALIVIEHGSIDSTPEILQALREEGLALELVPDNALGLHQADRMTRAARMSAALLNAHPIVPLDADEFLVATDTDAVVTLLREVPRDAVRVMRWRSYVPTSSDPAEEPDLLKRITFRSEYDLPVSKVVIGGDVARREDFRIGTGSHEVVLGTERVFNEFNEDRIALAHFPVRSAAQLTAKIVQQRFSMHVTRNRPPLKGEHYRVLDSAVSVSPFMTPAELHTAALLFCFPENAPNPSLIHDPLPVSDSLRYPMRRDISFLDIVESFAKNLADQHDEADNRHDQSSTVDTLLYEENQTLRHSTQALRDEVAALRDLCKELSDKLQDETQKHSDSQHKCLDLQHECIALNQALLEVWPRPWIAFLRGKLASVRSKCGALRARLLNRF